MLPITFFDAMEQAILKGCIVLGLVLAIGSSVAHAGCTTNDECKFNRKCVDGKCVMAQESPSRNELEAAAKVRARGATPTTDPDAPPTMHGPQDASGPSLAFLSYRVLLDMLSEAGVWAALLLIVLRVLHSREERRYLFADFEGSRLLDIALIALEGEKDLTEIPLVTGELLARLRGLEQRLKSKKVARKALRHETLKLLVNHERFSEVEQVAQKSGTSAPGFSRVRESLST